MDKNVPLVSILIPAFNQERTVGEAIESVLMQSYLNKEIIVCDDHSTDSTLRVIRQYEGVKVYSNEKNLGRVKNYQQLLCKYAGGKYILMLDGDDYLTDKAFIEEAVHLLTEEKLIFVFGKQRVFLEGCGVLIEDSVNSKLTAVIEGNELFLRLPQGVVIPHNACVFERSKAIDAGMYSKDIISADRHGFFLIMQGERVGFINKYVSVWRKHRSNVSKSINPDLIMSNVLSITEPAKKAVWISDIDKWENEMLCRFFINYLVRFKWQNNGADVQETLLRIEKQHPKVYLRVKLYLFFWTLILRNQFLTKLVVMRFLGLESYYREHLSY